MRFQQMKQIQQRKKTDISKESKHSHDNTIDFIIIKKDCTNSPFCCKIYLGE